MGNKELSQLWKWSDANPNALTDPQRVQTPAITEYWKPLAEEVYCWKGLCFSARQDLEGFSRFTEYGIEGVVPLELLPPEVRSKYQAKPNDRTKRAKKDETKSSGHAGEDTQIATPGGEAVVGRHDREATTGPADMEITMATGSNSQGSTPTPDEHEKRRLETPHTTGQQPGQLEPDGEVDAGEMDPEVDVDP